MLTPVLETPRLRLRPFEDRDVDGLFELESDPMVMRYGSHTPWTTRAQAVEKLAIILSREHAGAAFTWVVADKETDALIGDTVLFRVEREHGRCELGYALLPPHHGKGYGLEAVRAAVTWAFGTLGLRRIEADADPRNVRSCHLLEKVGFRREGYLRERWCVGGEIQDAAFYGLLKPDLVPGPT